MKISRSSPLIGLAGAGLGLALILVLGVSTPFGQGRQGRRPQAKGLFAGPLERSINLGDLWFIQSSEKAGATGDVISQPGYALRGWYPAVVPSTVLGTLVELGIYGDVFLGDNLKSVPAEQFAKSWWYRREFTVPPGPGIDRVGLEFDGINYRADIWLNGTKVADASKIFGSFRRFEIDVTKEVKRTERNVLAIEIFPPQPGEPTIGFVDWNPAPPDKNMGLWREVRVRATGDVSIGSPFVVTDLDLESLKKARLTISAELQNHSSVPVSGDLEGRIESRRFSEEVTLAPGEKRTVTFTPENHGDLIVDNPRIWWTHDLGTPELYVLSLAFRQKLDEKRLQKMAEEEKAREKEEMDEAEKEAEAKKTSRLKDTPWDRSQDQVKQDRLPRNYYSDVKIVRFGIREVSDYINDQGQRGYMLNGRKVLIRGGGWTDDIFLNVQPKKLLAEILYAKHMNLNALRLEGFWGTSEALYNLCDQTGILLMAGWSCHWEWENYLGKPVDENYGGIRSPEDIELIAESWEDQVKWLRNHPSIFVWAEASDKLPHPELEQKYIDIMKEIDPTRPTLVSTKGQTSTVSGKSAVKMLGPYDYVPPVYWYVDKQNGGAYGFNTETGPGPQVPPVESLRRMIPEDKLWPINDVWFFHANRGRFQDLARYNEAMDNRLGASASVEEYARKAQFLNYEGMRAMFEAFVANRYASTGIIQWMYNSAWPALWWQLYDYYLMPNGAFYGARKANEPVHILLDYGTREIVVSNGTREAVDKLKAEIRIYDLNLRERYAKTVDLSLAADEIRRIETLPTPEGLTPVFFVDLRLITGKNALSDTNFYCLSTKGETLDEDQATWYVTPVKDYADFTALNGLPPVKLRVKDKFDASGPTYKVTVEIENPSKGLAFMIELNVLRQDSDELVLPIFWDDNYVTLLPGEKRKISGAFYADDLRGEKPVLRLKGWNIEE